MKGILGRKIGMTQIFTDGGQAIAVTVIEAKPNIVTAILTKEKNGYDALQLGVEDKKKPQQKKPELGHFAKANTLPKKFVKEFKNMDGFELGQKVEASIFSAGDLVDVIGTSKGKGFAGAIKRHNQSIGPKSHGGGGGSQPQRQTGSLGDIAGNKVVKGMTMPGHMGSEKTTMQNLEIVAIDISNNVILVKGSIPGPKKSFVIVREAIKGLPSKDSVTLVNINEAKIKNELLEEAKKVGADVNTDMSVSEMRTSITVALEAKKAEEDAAKAKKAEEAAKEEAKKVEIAAKKAEEAKAKADAANDEAAKKEAEVKAKQLEKQAAAVEAKAIEAKKVAEAAKLAEETAAESKKVEEKALKEKEKLAKAKAEKAKADKLAKAKAEKAKADKEKAELSAKEKENQKVKELDKHALKVEAEALKVKEAAKKLDKNASKVEADAAKAKVEADAAKAKADKAAKDASKIKHEADKAEQVAAKVKAEAQVAAKEALKVKQEAAKVKAEADKVKEVATKVKEEAKVAAVEAKKVEVAAEKAREKVEKAEAKEGE